MNKKTYITPSVQVISMNICGIVMTSSTPSYDNELPGDVGDNVDININPGDDSDGEDAGGAF